MNKKKVLALVACAVLLVVGSVMATMAWLTSTTETATNTFTVGNVEITLDEADVDEYGEIESDARVLENEYKLIPGHKYTKDPFVEVAKGSEPCWLFVKVENGLSAIEKNDKNTIADQMGIAGWIKLDGVDNVYYHKDIVDARNNAEGKQVFAALTIAGDADVAKYKDEKIIVKAYAVQADGFATAAEAWAGAPATW